MTAQAAARCDSCGAVREASQLYAPYIGVLRCRDVAGCERRQLRAFDPTILPDEDMPRAPTATGTCAVCQAPSSVAELYQRIPGGSTWICRDRTVCDLRTVMGMAPVREDFADDLIPSAEMRAMQAAAPAVIPAERPAPSQDELNAEAWRTAMGRKGTA